MDGERPTVVTEQAHHQPHESRLARAVGSEHAEYFPFPHGKRKSVQYLECAVAERKVTRFDHKVALHERRFGVQFNCPLGWSARVSTIASDIQARYRA